VQKLVDYRLGLFASPSYLQEFDPSTRSRSYHARSSLYVDDYVDIEEQRYMQRIVAKSRAGFRATNILAQYVALTAGMGVESFPSIKRARIPLSFAYCQ